MLVRVVMFIYIAYTTFIYSILIFFVFHYLEFLIPELTTQNEKKSLKLPDLESIISELMTQK